MPFPKFLFSINFLYILLIAAEIAAIIFLCLILPWMLPVAAAVIGVWLFSAITAVIAARRARSPEISGAVILFIIALPVVGAVVYLIASVKKKRCAVLKVENAKSKSGLESSAAVFCGTGGAAYSKAVYLKNGEDYFKLLLCEIEKAEKFVYLEYFIIGRGKIFARLITALKRAKENGAEIKIVIDGIGSAFKAGKRDIKRLKALGAEVKIFNKLLPLPRSRLNLRDHRKIAAIDGKVAFTGGINLADEYANIVSPYGFWKDTGVAVYGQAAEVFAGMFLCALNKDQTVTLQPAEGKVCVPYCDSPYQKAGFAESAYAYAINAANYRVHIMTPYFCPGEKIAAALVFAAARGVDVRIIIPHIPDKKYAFELSKTFARELAEKGIKFYEFTPGFMHAKSVICDDTLFIGSYNFDFRSLNLNYECGVAFYDGVAEDAERDFIECMRLSAPLAEEKISPTRKFYRGVLKLFAPLM